MYALNFEKPPAVIGHLIPHGNLPSKGLYSLVQWWYHFYERPDPNLESAFNQARRYYERTRGFLDKTQILALTYDWFAIPQICGEINKKLWRKRVRLQLETLKKRSPQQIEETLATVPLRFVSEPPASTMRYRIFKHKKPLAAHGPAGLALNLTADDPFNASFESRRSHNTYAPIYESSEDEPHKAGNRTGVAGSRPSATPKKAAGPTDASSRESQTRLRAPMIGRLAGSSVSTTPVHGQTGCEKMSPSSKQLRNIPALSSIPVETGRNETRRRENEDKPCYPFYAKFHY